MFKFGIIGAANIANKFCDAVKMIDDAKVIAIASATPDKAKKFAEKNEIENYYTSYEEMLSRDDIDGVYIATTHNFHYENAMLCLEKGKPFICEKCLTLTKAEAEAIFEKAKEKNLFSMEAMWSRFLPTINKAKEWIESGKLGQIDLLTYLIGFKADNHKGSRMYEKSLAGGAMYDIGVYAIEITTYLINEKLKNVKSVVTRTENTGVDKVDSMILEFDNCVASLNCIMTANVESSMNIYGTDGRISIINPNYSNSCTFIGNNGVVETFTARLDNGFEYEIQEFISGVKSGKLESNIIPHKDTLQCAEIFDKCLETK